MEQPSEPQAPQNPALRGALEGHTLAVAQTAREVAMPSGDVSLRANIINSQGPHLGNCTPAQIHRLNLMEALAADLEMVGLIKEAAWWRGLALSEVNLTRSIDGFQQRLAMEHTIRTSIENSQAKPRTMKGRLLNRGREEEYR